MIEKSDMQMILSDKYAATLKRNASSSCIAFSEKVSQQ